VNWLLVALGGAAGAVARYGAGRWVGVPAGAGFPWATFGVNVAGSLLLGIVVALVPPDDPRRALLAVGFCGGLTTFSTFGYETMVLWQHRAYGVAAAYVGLSVVSGLLGVVLGMWGATRLAS
jgi:CrcB protein